MALASSSRCLYTDLTSFLKRMQTNAVRLATAEYPSPVLFWLDLPEHGRFWLDAVWSIAGEKYAKCQTADTATEGILDFDCVAEAH